MNLLKILSQIDIGEDELDIPKTTVDDTTYLDLLELAFAILGAVAFLIIILAGVRFILSRGEPDKVTKARNTIIYAAIGLVLAVSAFTIVRFIAGAIE
jgi:hypothetical protein